MNDDTLKNLTSLCRIHASKEEEEKLLSDLKAILNYVELLNQVDTEHVPPCNHVLEEFANVYRPDVIGPTMPRALFLANAPDQIGGMIRTPPVIKKST